MTGYNFKKEINYYSVLGVDQNASGAVITKAYRELARQWHPDKNKSAEAQQKFIPIRDAYEVLSDSTARSEYDNFLKYGSSQYSSSQPVCSQTQNIYANGSKLDFKLSCRLKVKDADQIIKAIADANLKCPTYHFSLTLDPKVGVNQICNGHNIDLHACVNSAKAELLPEWDIDFNLACTFSA